MEFLLVQVFRLRGMKKPRHARGETRFEVTGQMVQAMKL